MARITYTSNLSRKGALVEESLVALRQVEAGDSLETVRARVLDEDLLAKTARATRQGVWEEIRSRYLTEDRLVPLLARMVTRAPRRTTAQLILFYEFCQSEPLLRDTVLHYAYPRHLSGFSGLSKSDLQHYFDRLSPEQPEMAAWSPQTRDKVVSNILSILRDFGLLSGTQRKQFARLYVPLDTFVYVLYRLRDRGLATAPDVVKAEDWHLFWLEQDDVMALLQEASAQGHCVFKHQADVMDLEWVYPTLEACVEALTGQV